eukprot:TRINITY_DN1236_c0_g1_i1.p1 TRINITY_DN1236_c0_g1~~TRINITY_DN1236_c0_g1_i1.p1  ORF type:complete len:556 (+),score=135.22 TRINITY_DN1236_c0_g1_i1:43-1710(+)
MTVELCASSRNALPADQAAEVTALLSVYVKGQGGNPIDVICVIDTSGSMNHAMGLVKSCMKETVSGLSGGDRLGMVCFASRAQVKLPLTPMDAEGKQLAEQVIGGMNATGGTDIEGALKETFAVVGSASPYEAAAAVVIFLTDGLPTSGSVRDREGLLQVARECFAHGRDSHYKSISLFSFGFGNSHDARFLYELSNYGKGCYSYISSTEEIASNLEACFAFSTNIVTCDMVLEVESHGDCVVKKVHSRYETEGTTVKLSDINANQERYILVDLLLPEVDAATESTHAATARLSYYDVRNGCYEDVQCAVHVPRGDSAEINENVEVHKMRLLAAYALERASALCDKRLITEAANLIKGTVNTILASCVKDAADCQELLADLKLCEQGLQHTSGLLSVASNVGYGNVGSARSHHGRGRWGHRGRHAPAAVSAPDHGTTVEMTALYVTPSLLINHEGEGYRIIRKTVSAAGKHGNPKVMMELAHIATGSSKMLVLPATHAVRLYAAPEKKETFSRESPCVACNESDPCVEVMYYRTCTHETCPSCFATMPECLMCYH